MVARLLGLEPATAAGFDPQRLFFARPWPLWVAAAILLGVLLWTAWLYRREGYRASTLYKSGLVLLRVGAVATLLLLLAQPMLRLEREERIPSHVVVLIDRSASMERKDPWQHAGARARLVRAVGDPEAPRLTRLEILRLVLSRADVNLLRRLEARHRLHVYLFAGDVVELSKPSAGDQTPDSKEGHSLTPDVWRAIPGLDQSATRIGDALERVLSDLAGQPLAGIVLFTDGGQNLGEDPVAAAGRAAGRGVPIYAVGVGDPNPPRDVAVTSALVDSVVRKGDEVIVSVGVQQRGSPPARRLPVTLRQTVGSRSDGSARFDGGRFPAVSADPGSRSDGSARFDGGRFPAVSADPGSPSPPGRVLATGEAVFTDGGDTATVSLSFRPQQTGALTLQVAVPAQPGELSLANNRRLLSVRVVDKKLKILYLEATPRWEYRYLRNAILRDTSIQFACLLTEADPRLGGEGNLPISGFPRDLAELFRYDIVILGDVPRVYFSSEQLEWLRRFVQERGGSLIVIAGEASMPWEYAATPLAELLPVLLPDSREAVVSDEPFRLKLTEAGKRHPMLLFSERPEENAQIWAELPGMYWCAAVPRVKPGATVLAVHPTRTSESGPLPLLVVQQTGEGRVFLSLVDSTWQWRFRLGDTRFYRYWGQVLRWLAPRELPGENRTVRLTTERTRYLAGERVTLRARLLTPTFHPLRVPFVTARVVRDDGAAATVRLLSQPETPGLYVGEWLPPRAGSYEVSLASESEAATARFEVESVVLEQENPELNEALLTRIAAETKGAVVPLEQVGALPDRLKDASTRVTSRLEHELWDTPLPLALFTLFLVGEWALRKRKGLL